MPGTNKLPQRGVTPSGGATAPGEAARASGSTRWAMGGIALLCVLAYAPAILDTLSGSWPFGADSIAAFRPWRELMQQAVRQGRLPLWNPYSFCGEPFISNMSNGHGIVFNPQTLLYCLFPVRVAMLLDAIGHNILMGLGAYLLARALGLSRTASWIAAVALALGGSVSARIYAGYLNWHAVRAYLPWEMWSLLTYLRTGRPRWLFIVVGLFTLQTACAFAPVSLLSAALCCGLLLACTLTHRRFVRPGTTGPRGRDGRLNPAILPRGWIKHFGLSTTLLSMLVAVNILCLAQTVHSSARGQQIPYQEATRFALGWPTLVRLLIPGFFGGSNVPQWSMENAAHEEVAYTGVLVLLLAVGAPLLARRPWLIQQASGVIPAPVPAPVAAGASSRMNPVTDAAANALPPRGAAVRAVVPDTKSVSSRLVPAVPWLWACLPVAVVMSLGRQMPFHHWLFNHVAIFRILRSPVRWMELWSVTVPFLAGFSFDCCFPGPRPGRELEAETKDQGAGAVNAPLPAAGWLGVSLGILGGCAFILALAVGRIPPEAQLWMKTAQWTVVVKDAHTQLLLANYLRSTAIIGALQAGVLALGYAVLCGCWMRTTQPRARQQITTLLAGLSTLDVLLLFWQSSNCVSPAKMRAQVLWPPALARHYQPVQRWTTGTDWLAVNSNVPLHIADFGGYNPLNSQRYFEWAHALEGRNFWKDFYQPSFYGPLLRVAGVTHTLSGGTEPPQARGGLPPPALVDQWGDWRLWYHPGAWPRVYLARHVQSAGAGHQLAVLSALASQPFDERRPTVVMAPGQASGIPDEALAPNERVLKWSSDWNSMTVDTAVTKPCLVVQSEMFYPGWHAWVNGRATDVENANYLFRALRVPAGASHTIVVYEPQIYRFSLFVSLSGLAICAGMAAVKLSPGIGPCDRRS